MKKLFLAGLFVLLGALLLTSGCRFDFLGMKLGNFENSEANKAKAPATEFRDIYFTYGIGGKNVLDTAAKQYVVDMVCEPAITYTLELNDADRQKIGEALLRNNFFDLADKYTENCTANGSCQVATGMEESLLVVTTADGQKKVSWNSTYYNQDSAEFQRLVAVAAVIQEVVKSHEKELGAKEPKCAYL